MIQAHRVLTSPSLVGTETSSFSGIRTSLHSPTARLILHPPPLRDPTENRVDSTELLCHSQIPSCFLNLLRRRLRSKIPGRWYNNHHWMMPWTRRMEKFRGVMIKKCAGMDQRACATTACRWSHTRPNTWL